MDMKRQTVAAGRLFALRGGLLVAGVVGLLLLAGCIPPQRTVDFEASSVEGLAPLPIVFTAVADADAQSYVWDFGDGGTSEEPTPLHVYRDGGAYTVSLTVVFADGATGSATKSDFIQVALSDAQPGHLYWIGGGSIWRGDLDGSSKQAIIPNVVDGQTLVVEADKLYWTIDQGNGRIEQANLDGTDRQTLVSAVYRPRGLTIDPRYGKLYWTTFPTPIPTYSPDPQVARAMRSNLDGTNVEEIFDFFLLSPEQRRCADVIAVDPLANRLVWAFQTNGVNFFQDYEEEYANQLHSLRTDGTSLRVIRSNLTHVADLVLDLLPGAEALHMYWICRGGSVAEAVKTDILVRANPNAETEKILVTGIDGGTSLDIDVAQGTLYWSDKAGIHRANLDGTSPSLIFPGVAAKSIALDR